MSHYRDQGEYRLHDFVVMRNHFHAQIPLGADKSVERAMQLIRGGFSYRAKTELGLKRTIWQRGFSEARLYGDPGGLGATNGVQSLHSFFLLMDDPSVYGLPTAPRLPSRNVVPGLLASLGTAVVRPEH